MGKRVQLMSGLNYKGFYAALRAAGLETQKEALLSGYGAESVKDLTAKELKELTDRLNAIAAERKPKEVSESEKATRKKRSTCLDLLTRLGVYSGSDSWARVNAYLMLPRIAGKLLYEMSDDELDALARKLRSVYAKRLKGDTTTNINANYN